MTQAANPAPPTAKPVPHETTVHGDQRVDNYFWLRDKTNPDTIAYLEAENQYAEAYMGSTGDLRQTLYSEILGRIKEDDLSVPVWWGGWFYYTRTETGKAYSIQCRKQGSLDAAEQILLDSNVLAHGQKYFRLGNFEISPNHALLAYSTDLEGNENFTIRVKDLTTGVLLSDEIHNTYYSIAWANDNRTFFYTVLDESLRPFQLWRHRLGASTDTLVYQEDDRRFAIGVHTTRSREFIMLGSDSPLTSELRYLRTDQPEGEFTLVLPRQQGVEYSAEHQGDFFYIHINDTAPDFRLIRTPISNPSKDNSTELIPARPGITIEDVEGFRDFVVLLERARGLETIRIAPAGDLEHFEPIEFPEPVYTAGVTANPEYDSHVLRFAYSSLVTPDSVFDYDMVTKQRVLMKQYEVLGGYDPSLYESERLFARAPDGTEVPISLVRRKGQTNNGRTPCLLYGYGAYGAATDPRFASDRLSLLDRGFVYAIAHVRGGGDLGKRWHDAGKLLCKRNSFSDFIACAERLLEGGYTSPDLLAIRGGSAGGLLMGAVVNLRPELFRAVVAKVPFVDVLNTMLDPSLPLTVSEYEEWGNPEDPEYYRYIRSYSPYDNVEARERPAMLVTAGLNDPRVSYWEPAKWVAKLRAMQTGQNVLLLKTNMGAGHFGPSGRYESIKETAYDYAFILSITGLPGSL